MVTNVPPSRRQRGPGGRNGQVYRAIADETRRAILDRLAAGPLTVREIARHFPVSRPAISKHLRLLRAARLVAPVKQGRERVYHASPAPLATVDAWLTRYRVFWQARLNELKWIVESEDQPPKGEAPS